MPSQFTAKQLNGRQVMIMLNVRKILYCLFQLKYNHNVGIGSKIKELLNTRTEKPSISGDDRHTIETLGRS